MANNMLITPLDTTDALLAERATTSLPVVVGAAATPTAAVTERAAPPSAPPPCDPKVTDVTKLPGLMDRKSFTQGAILLREWLSLPSSVNPKFAVTDTSTITMEFVLGFPRAKKEFNRIFSEKLYMAGNVRAQIGTLLRRLGKDKGGSFDFNRPVEELDPGPEPVQSFDVTYVKVGSLTDPIDGLTAALGRFLLKVDVAGHVDKDPSTKGMRVTLTEVGVHVEDRFDFNDHQLLGCWNICTDEVGRLTCGGVEYNNGDFREFRKKTGMGGDIWVLSDVKSVKLDPPETFDLR